jgi:hypothetical protein
VWKVLSKTNKAQAEATRAVGERESLEMQMAQLKQQNESDLKLEREEFNRSITYVSISN